MSVSSYSCRSSCRIFSKLCDLRVPSALSAFKSLVSVVHSSATDAHSGGLRSPALAFRDVSFAYRREPVIEHVSMEVTPGEMVGLIGPNGAGKSTLLRLAAGVLSAGSGAVCMAGDDVRRIARREIARRVAVLPQEFSVQFAYTVRQIVEMGRFPYGDLWGSLHRDDHTAVAAALETTDTAHLADRVYNELSGGERQRVLIALAVAQGSPLLLLDEPTAHLDIKHQVETLELLRRLNREQGLTVVAALHDLNLAARYFPRLVLFRRTVIADGPPTRVLDGALLSSVYETPVRIGILPGEEHLSVLPITHPFERREEGATGATLAAPERQDI
jgi:iron complex transport system ATP-binding protein